jgi:hypothetical protein
VGAPTEKGGGTLIEALGSRLGPFPFLDRESGGAIGKGHSGHPTVSKNVLKERAG